MSCNKCNANISLAKTIVYNVNNVKYHPKSTKLETIMNYKSVNNCIWRYTAIKRKKFQHHNINKESNIASNFEFSFDFHSDSLKSILNNVIMEMKSFQKH